MTIKDVLNIGVKKRLECENPTNRGNLECEILLCNILNKDRIFLHTNSNLALQDSIIETFFSQIERLKNNYPLEYITKKVSFYSMEFFIDEGALIPRPETEILIDKVLDLIKKHNITQIYEIGIGSGIISIILALHCKNLKITATDISKQSLKIARKNLKLKSKLDFTLEKRIKLVQTNLLDNIAFDKNALIVSNPPYINNSYKIPLNLAFEPQIALFGGEIGDEIIRQIIDLDSTFLCCEISYNQGYLKKYLSYYKFVEFYKDYSNLTRGFVASKV